MFIFLEVRGQLRKAIWDTKHNFLNEYVVLYINAAVENIMMEVFHGLIFNYYCPQL